MSTPLNQPKSETITFSYIWTITDFSQNLVSSFVHPCLTSCTFPSTSSTAKSPLFRLSLFPEGVNENFVDYLSIGFSAISLIENDEKITVRYRVSLINSKGERRCTKEWLYIFSSSKRVSVFGRFVARSDLLDASNGLLLDDKLVIHCEGTVLGEPTPLDYASTNLSDLKFIAKSQSDLMVKMLYNLATKHQLTYYSPNGIPNFEIQNQVDETFSYSYNAKLYNDQFFTWSQSKYMKNTEELKLHSHQEMLDLLRFWMVSGKHSDLSLVFQGGQGVKLFSVHKIIIHNRSSVFDVLLQQNNRLSIGDEPFEVLNQLIHYLYTGKVPLLKKYQYELLNVSCEFDFYLLNQMSQLSICDEISNGNVIHTLIYANSVSADLLKRVCLEYITDHAAELMFDLDLLKTDFIEEMFRNLAFKNAFKESEDRQVYDNLQLKIVSTEIEESLSYTHLKKYHIFNEFLYNDYIDDYTFVYLFESAEFCAQENSSLKFKLIKLRPVDYMKSKDFDLMVKNDRCFHLSEPQVSLIRYNLSLFFDDEPDFTLGTCDGCEYVQVSSNYTRVGDKLSLQNRDALDFYYPDRNYVQFSEVTQSSIPLSGTFKIRSEIDVLCGISALDFTPVRTLSQLDLGQSRKHFFECMNALLLKCDNDQVKLSCLHKIVLLNRSSAFDALMHNILQKPNNRVSIGDVPSEVFDQLIQYLYTGKVPLLKKYQYELLNVACEYEFDVLKQMCELVICDEITIENVIHTLIYANSVSADLLKRAALNCITDHATELMFELDALKPELIEEMYQNLASKHRLSESDYAYEQKVIPKFATQNQVDETFSYTHISLCNELLFCPAWSNAKYNTRSSQELKQLSGRLMLDTLCYWMNSGTHVDLFLVIGEQEELLSLHSIVLLNRSSAFDALIHNNTIVTEGQTKRVFITDAQIEVLAQMIQYLYSGKVPLLKEYHYELLNVACEYDFDILKQMCERTICDQIATENVIDMLIFANQVSADLLKRATLDYISDHATELMFDLGALKPGLIEEITSYTHLKMFRTLNEFTFEDFIDDFCPYQFKCPEFCASENSSLKFKLIQLQPVYYRNKDFDLMVKNDRCYDLSDSQVSLIRYKMSLYQCLDNESYEAMGTCDGWENLQVSSIYTRVSRKLSFQNRVIPKDYVLVFPPLMGTFKMRCEIAVLNVISAQDLSPIRGLPQLELEQSRKHLFECMNSSLLKCDDDKRDVTLVVRGAELKVHSVFLVQSPVLRALVAQLNRIDIPDLSIEAFEQLMQYLYTGTVKSLDKYAKELLFVAKRYKLKILAQMCQCAMIMVRTNFLPNLQMANLDSANDVYK